MTTTKNAGVRDLTADQKAVLRWMDRTNTGAVHFEGGYRFPEAFRRDAALATRYALKNPAV